MFSERFGVPHRTVRQSNNSQAGDNVMSMKAMSTRLRRLRLMSTRVNSAPVRPVAQDQ